MNLNLKNKLLIAFIILFLYVVYNFALSKTIYYAKSFYALEKTLQESNAEKEALDDLHKKNKNLDQIIKNQNHLNLSNPQNELLKIISNLCETNYVRIVFFEEPEIKIVSNKETILYKFGLEGSFNSILGLINQFESENTIGKIKHLNTTKHIDYNTNKENIITTVFIERIVDVK